ncbi:MAG: hypothetical protein D6820_08760, partial [Lentisphaerae bacterium]
MLQLISDDLAQVGLHVVLNTNRTLTRTILKSRRWELSFDNPDQICPLQENGIVFYPSYFLKGLLSQKTVNLWDRVNWPAPDSPPPCETHPLYKGLVLAVKTLNASTREEQARFLKQYFDLAAREVWTTGICTRGFQPVIVKHGFKNVPREGVYTWDYLSPANLGLETYFMVPDRSTPEAVNTPQTETLLRKAILSCIEQGKKQTVSHLQHPTSSAAREREDQSSAMLVLYSAVGLLLIGLILLSFRYPFILRRLCIMIPQLLIISI